MSLVKTAAELREWLRQNGRKDKTLGLVPTMGYLHEGHLSLIKAAKAENDLVAVSVFVNPTQFGPGEDFEKYPRDIERDYKMAVSAGADVVFNPEAGEMYGPGASTFVAEEGGVTKKLCGLSRPVHFRGVTTVVSMLFNIAGPNRAYFGQKDAQQAIVIKKMVRDLHFPVEIRVCPIVREPDGLAKSSRNIYLSPEERAAALVLSRSLKNAAERLASDGNTRVSHIRESILTEIKTEPMADVDYVEVLDGETLEEIETIAPGKKALAAVAVRFGKTRLIDNIILTV